jgi:DNA polymerase/3'-5' exonuclease PolX
MTNTEIAPTLEAYAALLDLSGAGHYAVRAYRRAPELLRETRLPDDEHVGAGRASEVGGKGARV